MERKKDNIELPITTLNSVQCCAELGTAELGTRIDAISQRLGTRENAASIAGLSVDQLVGYIKGRNKPGFLPLARMALAAGVSLDWVATGEKEVRVSPDAATPCVEVETLRKAVEAVEMMGRDAPVERKALAIARVYERLVISQGQPDMIEMMRLIQAVLADTPYI